MSYAGTTSFRMIQTTDAEFRAWGLAINAQLALMGLVQTADTGQINWTTVLKPAAGGASQGYEIWRFADALQATDPVFIKLEYGSTGSGATAPGLYLTVGTATDGAGTLTGIVSTRYQVGLGAAWGAIKLCVFSGDTDRMAMVLNVTDQFGGGGTMLLSVERKVNAAGVRVAGGTLITVSQTNTGMSGTGRQEYFEHGIAPFVEATIGIFLPRVAGGIGVDGTEVSLFPQYHARGGLLPHGLNLMGYLSGSIGAYAQFTTTVYGAIHTYYALGEVCGNTFNRTSESLGRVAMRFE